MAKEILTEEMQEKGRLLLETVDKILPGIIKSAFWILIDPPGNKWELVFIAPKKYYDHPWLGSPTFGATLEISGSRKDAIMLQAINEEVTFPLTVVNFQVIDTLSFSAYAYRYRL